MPSALQDTHLPLRSSSHEPHVELVKEEMMPGTSCELPLLDPWLEPGRQWGSRHSPPNLWEGATCCRLVELIVAALLTAEIAFFASLIPMPIKRLIASVVMAIAATLDPGLEAFIFRSSPFVFSGLCRF